MPQAKPRDKFRERLASPSGISLKHIDIVGLQKRYRPKHYVYILEATYSDDSQHIIYRKYSEFFEFHVSLADKFPEESGKYETSRRIMPFLPGKKIFQGEFRQLAAKRKDSLSDYCNALIKLDGRISQHILVMKFFEARASDISPPKDATMKSEKSNLLKALLQGYGGRKKDRKRSGSVDDSAGPNISGPIVLQTYRAIADYKAVDKGEVSFKEDDVIDVVDKNENGWWFVQMEDKQGWAPASYLLPHSEDAESDQPQPLFNYEQHIAVEDYTAVLEDEITMKKGALVNVMHKLLDGWWIVHHNGAVGYAPATYLMAYQATVPGTTSVPMDVVPTEENGTGNDRDTFKPNLPDLSQLIQDATGATSIKKPTKRRCTIKSSERISSGERHSTEDLIMYRKMSTKMQQRQIEKRSRLLRQRPQLPPPTDAEEPDSDLSIYVQPGEIETEYLKNISAESKSPVKEQRKMAELPTTNSQWPVKEQRKMAELPATNSQWPVKEQRKMAELPTTNSQWPVKEQRKMAELPTTKTQTAEENKTSQWKPRTGGKLSHQVATPTPDAEETTDYEIIDEEDEDHDYTNLSDDADDKRVRNDEDDDDDDDAEYVNVVIEKSKAVRKTTLLPPDETPPTIPTKQRDLAPMRPPRQLDNSSTSSSQPPIVKKQNGAFSNGTKSPARNSPVLSRIENNINNKSSGLKLRSGEIGQKEESDAPASKTKGMASRIAIFDN